MLCKEFDKHIFFFHLFNNDVLVYRDADADADDDDGYV